MTCALDHDRLLQVYYFNPLLLTIIFIKSIN